VKLRWSSAVVKELRVVRVVPPAGTGAKNVEPHKRLRKRSIQVSLAA